MPFRLFLLPFLVVLLTAACSSEPRGSAGVQFLEYAQTNLARNEYEQALKNIEQLVKVEGDSPLGRQGLAMHVALVTAMADGAETMAAAYDEGSGTSTAAAQKAQFVKMKSDYYGIARVRLLDAMEKVMGQRGELGEQPLPFQVSFPGFTGSEHPALVSIRNGNWLADDQRYEGEVATIRNALAAVYTRLAGAGDDLHKGQAAFQAEGIEIDPRTYLIELSRTFLRLSRIFDRGALDDSRYRRICHEVVRDNLDAALKLLETRPDDELKATAEQLRKECEETLKKLG